MSTNPKVTYEDVALLEEILGESRDWMLAREIAAHPTWVAHNTKMSSQHSERKIRAIASASGGSVLSHPGSTGYKLRSAATLSEVETAIRKLLHQAGEMARRAHQIEQYGNRQREGTLV